MEDVLAVYTPATRSGCPLVCRGRDLKANSSLRRRCRSDETRASGPFRLRVRAQRHANLFMMFSPLEGSASRQSHDRHTAVDYAHVLKTGRRSLPHRQDHRIWSRTIQHHSKASLYEAFPAPEARDVERFERHYTPKTRQLARSGGVETRRPFVSMPRPPASPTNKPSSTKSKPGSTIAMPNTPRPIGTSQPQTPVSNSNTYTRQSN